MKIKKLILPMMLAVILDCGLVACDSGNETKIDNLIYDLSYDGTYYIVSGNKESTDTNIVIPSAYNDLPVSSIAKDAFYNFSHLTSVTIPNSITYIDESAFYWCTNLTSIDIPNSVTTIKRDAFRGCKGLTEFVIPNSVTEIGEGVLRSCNNLKNLTIPFTGATSTSSSPYMKLFGYIFGEYYDGGVEVNQHYNENGEYHTFYLPPELTSVTITGNNVTDFAFSSCTTITSITLADSVTQIGNNAFSGCSNLTNINIPSNVTSIYRRTFSGCSSLTSITIPNSVTSIDGYVFEGCDNLTTIDFKGTMEEWNNISKANPWDGSTGNYTITCINGTIAKN